MDRSIRLSELLDESIYEGKGRKSSNYTYIIKVKIW